MCAIRLDSDVEGSAHYKTFIYAISDGQPHVTVAVTLGNIDEPVDRGRVGSLHDKKFLVPLPDLHADHVDKDNVERVGEVRTVAAAQFEPAMPQLVRQRAEGPLEPKRQTFPKVLGVHLRNP